MEDVAQNWESITEDFKTGVQKMVAARCKGKVLKRDRERVIKEIFSRIPSMADYRSYDGVGAPSFSDYRRHHRGSAA